MNKPNTVKAAEVATNTFKHHGMGAIPDEIDTRDYQYREIAVRGRVVELDDTMSLAQFLPKETWDQGQFGSCTSFAANLMVSAARAIAGLPYRRPSFMATWYWTKKSMYGEGMAHLNLGASIREAVMSTRREGVASDKVYPYKPENLNRPPSPEAYDDAEPHQSLYYFRIDDFESGEDGIDLDFAYRCLAEGWPISIALPLYSSFEPDYADGRIPYPGDGDKLEGYHAMVIYGYSLLGNQPFFRVRNSWGDWGGRHILPSGKHVEKGTCRIPVEYVRDFGFDCWTIRAVEDGKVENVPLEKVVK